MMKILIYVSMLVFLSCSKESEQGENSLKGLFEVDSITYKDYGADLYYKLRGNDGKPPYRYIWINPSDNVGNGPFHIKLMDSFNFVAMISDSKNNSDSIKYIYDYRDKVIGQYRCSFHYWGYGINHSDSTFIDTISISKSRNNMIVIDTVLISKSVYQLIYADTISFKLDSLWRFLDSNYRGYRYFHFYYNPNEDSVYISTEYGGLGAGTRSRYKGVKIKK